MVVIEKKVQDANELADKVYMMFVSQGYKLEEGTKLRGVYGNGSAVARALVGGFVKRNKFSVNIVQNANNGLNIIFDKAMSGFSGGVIGMSKMDKEFSRLQQMLYYL